MSVVIGFLYISKERLSFSFDMVISRNLFLFSFPSSIVNFMVDIMLLNTLNTSYMFVVSLLYAMGILSTYRKYPHTVKPALNGPFIKQNLS